MKMGEAFNSVPLALTNLLENLKFSISNDKHNRVINRIAVGIKREVSQI